MSTDYESVSGKELATQCAAVRRIQRSWRAYTAKRAHEEEREVTIRPYTKIVECRQANHAYFGRLLDTVSTPQIVPAFTELLANQIYFDQLVETFKDPQFDPVFSGMLQSADVDKEDD
eukprot:8139623-Karenia_brevis.AAC.1